jgi:hypothetical protein
LGAIETCYVVSMDVLSTVLFTLDSQGQARGASNTRKNKGWLRSKIEKVIPGERRF